MPVVSGNKILSDDSLLYISFYLYFQLCHIGSLQSVTQGIFVPWKSATIINKDFLLPTLNAGF